KNRIDYLNFTSQDQFKNFSTDLTGALAYKTLRPLESLGLAGFDIGISSGLSYFKHKQMSAVSNNSGDSMQSVGFHAVKGLPFGVDIGLDYTTFPNSNLSTWSGNLNWAFYQGGTVAPEFAINGNFTQSTGISALSYQSYGLDLGVSKGIFNFTPYATIGMVQSEVKAREANQVSGVDLQTVNSSLMKASVGVNINLMMMDVLVAYNQIGDVPTYSLKAGYRF
ncbi:MAG: hypothetical protein R3219_07790, partial [Hydrogenovibrio sp.]|nr:hypothetical protein [Hydrogenovibrio sp.]